ncbi:MAG: ribonuclease Y [Armatimonadetes bacterium]|nr:ribonuclease Y [Armatimonadota bacterium]MDW8153448.1 ribonuclease Y [Armatimonadota bacterium]
MTVLLVMAVGAVAFLAGYVFRKWIAESKIRSAEEEAKRILLDAQREADAKRKEALLEAKDEALRIKREAEREIREHRADLQRLERRLSQREEALERRAEQLERRERALQQQEQELAARAEEVAALIAQQHRKLEEIAGLTREEARQRLLEQVEAEAREDALARIRKVEREAREEAERRTREILALAIQRTAADHTAELTVSVVPLPTEEMKGRIIGREGRNIRTLEALTGVDFIIDDTPEAVTLSSFDPMRREVAKIALEKLMADGRIHPARIEEMVEKAQQELDQRIQEAGEQAAFEAGVHGLHPDLVKLLGRLRFRTSYGQNVLQHSVEVALLAGELAAQLGADVHMARRAGLLHDIGKALTHEVQGSHTQIGVDIARRYHEPPPVINAILYHHGEEEAKYLESVLVAAADAISGSRPGARKESVEAYIKRLQALEQLAQSFPGVEKAYAIQAGREIRVIVRSGEVDDLAAYRIARDLSRRIEQDLEYPGQIKVTVVRETRIVEYAR